MLVQTAADAVGLIADWAGRRAPSAATKNQGFWAFGFKDNAPDELWVTGDWNDDAGGRHPERWRPLRMRSENALIYKVLVNGFFGVQSHHQSTEDERIPEATNTLVWRNAAFVNWARFWTNTARTMLHFSGFGLTLSRQDMS